MTVTLRRARSASRCGGDVRCWPAWPDVLLVHGRLSPRSRPISALLSVRLYLLDRHGARLPGDFADASHGGRQVGHGDPPPMRGRGANDSVHGVLLLPVLLAMPVLYVWARPEAVHDAIIQSKAAYLNVPFFIARTVFYFAVWTLYAYLLSKWSAAGSHRRRRLISTNARGERAGTGGVHLHRDLRLRGLDHVAGAATGFRPCTERCSWSARCWRHSRWSSRW